jgi:hypothetical protein
MEKVFWAVLGFELMALYLLGKVLYRFSHACSPDAEDFS